VNNTLFANSWPIFLINVTNTLTNSINQNYQNNQTFSIGPLCNEIEKTLRKPAYLLILHINLVILAITLISTAFLIQKFTKDRIIFHGNLLV
jgi:hypothetical protein